MAELVEANESAAFDKLRQRGALAELAEANESAAFDKLRRRGALAEPAEANESAAFDKLRQRERWLSLSKPTRARPSTSSGSGSVG